MEKKNLAFVALAFLVLLVPAAVLAQSNDSGNNIMTDQQEAAPMMSNYGAQVRLIELQKSIQNNVILGQAVVDWMKTNTTTDTTSLQSIVDQLTAVKQEVAAVDPTGNKTVVIQQFLDLKSDAQNLTTQFRTTVHTEVNATDLAKIRQSVQDQITANIQQYNDQIKTALNQFNANWLQQILNDLNVSRPDLVTGLGNGTVTKSQVTAELRTIISNMMPQQRQQALLNMVSDMNGVSVKVLQAVENARIKQLDRMQQRMNVRLQNLRSMVARGRG